VGFAKANDSLFEFYKQDIGEFYWLPQKAFELVHGPYSEQELTVITWALPQTQAARRANRDMDFYPSLEWVRSRRQGEAVNNGLRNHLIQNLAGLGIRAVAPVLLADWQVRQQSPKYGRSSSWSERHAAYTAGLGTFGLCDGLITPRGKAVRVGSVVAEITLSPDARRPYANHMEYCLMASQGACGTCIKRCPAGANTQNGKDKAKCMAHTRGKVAEHLFPKYGIKGYACGLCQTGVPCESTMPSPDAIS
jgi:epoxyqueuosine reductase QueG